MCHRQASSGAKGIVDNSDNLQCKTHSGRETDRCGYSRNSCRKKCNSAACAIG